jgi:hypothetical protein
VAGSINDIADAYQWSISQIARAFGMDRKTVTRRIEDAAVRPAGKRGGYPVYALRDVGPALFGQAGTFGGAAMAPNEMMPNDRKSWYQSENERLKFESEMRQLVQSSEVAREMSIMAKAVISTLDGLPDLLERDCGLPPKAVERVQDIVDVMREQMYQSVTQDDE